LLRFFASLSGWPASLFALRGALWSNLLLLFRPQKLLWLVLIFDLLALLIWLRELLGFGLLLLFGLGILLGLSLLGLGLGVLL